MDIIESKKMDKKPQVFLPQAAFLGLQAEISLPKTDSLELPFKEKVRDIQPPTQVNNNSIDLLKPCQPKKLGSIRARLSERCIIPTRLAYLQPRLRLMTDIAEENDLEDDVFHFSV